MAYLGQPGGAGQGLSVSGGVPTWSNPGQNVRTTYELDFGTVTAENPVLSGAGTTTRTYNGVTWTYTNTTTGGAVSQVTSAAGLTHNATPNTSAILQANLSSLGATSVLAGAWRAWCYFDNFTLNDDNYCELLLMFGSTVASYSTRAYSPGFNANFYGSAGPTVSGGVVNKIQAGYTAYDILTIECCGGNIITRMGVYASGDWTNVDACRVFSVGSNSDATLATATSGTSVANAKIQIDTGKASGASVANRFKLFKFEVW